SPDAADVQKLLARHLDFANEHSPREDVHALDVSGLLGPEISFFSIRSDGALLGVGAIKRIDDAHAELKSIHTAELARGRGVGRAMVRHLVVLATASGYSRLSLETGSMDAFAPSRRLYEALGFEVCEPFEGYGPSPNSTFMTLTL
ncbi:MAG TPA: GNAT family N-acetyltransferase, partial [Acidimicrobiia bacterium]